MERALVLLASATLVGASVVNSVSNDAEPMAQYKGKQLLPQNQSRVVTGRATTPMTHDAPPPHIVLFTIKGVGSVIANGCSTGGGETASATSSWQNESGADQYINWVGNPYYDNPGAVLHHGEMRPVSLGGSAEAKPNMNVRTYQIGSPGGAVVTLTASSLGEVWESECHFFAQALVG